MIGFDLSPEQIELACERAPDARFEVASFVDAELPSGALAIALIGEVLNYAFDYRNDAGRLRELIGRAYEALLPGGLLLFDLAAPGRVPDPQPPASHLEGEDWAITYVAQEIKEPIPMLVRTMTDRPPRPRRPPRRTRRSTTSCSIRAPTWRRSCGRPASRSRCGTATRPTSSTRACPSTWRGSRALSQGSGSPRATAEASRAPPMPPAA